MKFFIRPSDNNMYEVVDSTGHVWKTFNFLENAWTEICDLEKFDKQGRLLHRPVFS